MKKKRLIPVVLIKNGWVVQSNNFNKYKNIGHPIPTIKRLSNFCSDEIIIIDITKNDFYENRRDDTNYNFKEDILSILKEISKVIFMPVAIGGKIKDISDAKLRIENGAENLVHYKWNTKVATHHFCSKCGIMTHHQRRTTPEICGINVGCFDEIDYCSFHDVPMNNGVELSLVEK